MGDMFTLADSKSGYSSPVMQDNQVPTIGEVKDIFAEATGKWTILNLTSPTVTDNVDPSPVLTNNASASGFPIGSTMIKWSAKDDADLVSEKMQRITIVDTKAPIITAPDDVSLIFDSAYQGHLPVDLGTPYVQDLVDPSPIITNDALSLTFPAGTTIVTWTATDSFGNSATDIQRIEIIKDGSGSVAEPQIEEEIPGQAASNIAEPVAEAVESSTIYSTGSTTYASGSGGGGGGGGGGGSSDSDGTEEPDTTAPGSDTTPPTIVAPAAIFAEATGTLTHVSLGSPTVSDDIDAELDIMNDAPEEGFPLGTTIVVWLVHDDEGNAAIAEQRVVIEDTTPPVILAPANIVAEATGVATPLNLSPPVVNDLADPTPTVSNDDLTVFPVGETTVIWTATDDSENSATATQIVTIIDTTPPVIIAPPDQVDYVEDAGDLIVIPLGTPTVNDLGDSSPTVTNDAPSEGFPLGITTVTWTATDDVGYTSTDTQLVTILLSEPNQSGPDNGGDNSNSTDPTPDPGPGTNSTDPEPQPDITPPTIVSPADIITGATGPLTLVHLGSPTVVDEDPIPVVTNDAPADEQFPIGETIIVWTATDASGNSAFDVQLVTVLDPGNEPNPEPTNSTDSTPPNITPPSDVIAEATGTLTILNLGVPVVSDLEDPEPEVTNDAPSAGFPIGTTIVTWVVIDTAGNNAGATQVVNIIDTNSPTIAVPADMTVEATGSGGAIVNYTAVSALDIVDGPLDVVCLPAQGTTFPLGTTDVFCSAVDSNGNEGSDSFTVTVQDTTPPSILPPSDVIAEATGTLTSVSLGSPSVSDTVDSDLSVTSDAPDNGFPIGTTTVTWTVIDDMGNSATANQSVVVSDSDAPVVTVPANKTVEATAPQGSIVAYSGQSATDAIEGLMTPVCMPASGSTFPLGTTTVTCTATDNEGNSGSAAFMIKVQDTTVPSIVAPPGIVMQSATALTSVALGSPTVSDIADSSVTVTNNAPSLGFPLGNTLVTWTATDDSGNSNTASQSVTIQVPTTYYTIPSIGGSKPISVVVGSTVHTVCDSACTHTSIQKAIDDLPSAGGKVVLKGTKAFSPTSTIFLRSNLVIEFEQGANMASSVSGKVFSGTNVNNVMFIEPTVTKSKFPDDVIYISNGNNIVVKGGMISGVKGGPENDKSNGFECRSCKNVLVEGGSYSTFSRPIGVTTNAAVWDGTTENVWVENNIVYDASIECIRVNDGTDMHVNGNNVSDCANNGIDIGFNVRVEANNNKIVRAGYGTTFNAVGIHTDTADVVVILNNTIDLSGTNGISLCSSDNNYVVGNTIRNSGQLVTDTLFTGDGHGIDIVRCKATNLPENTVIDQNVIINSNGGYGVYVGVGATNTNLTSNVLTGNEKGAYLNNGTGTKISGNTI
jgi:parallel beta-helix repeat protein